MCTTHHSVCLTNGEYTPGFFLPFDVTRIGPEVDVTWHRHGPGYFALPGTETPVQPATTSIYKPLHRQGLDSKRQRVDSFAKLRVVSRNGYRPVD